MVSQKEAKEAVMHLWRAVWAGYDIILPVRERKEEDAKFFGDASLKIEGKEYTPRFWGMNNTKPNHGVAQLYVDQQSERSLPEV